MTSTAESEDEDQRRLPGMGTRTPPGEGVSPLAGAAHQFTPNSKAVVFALIPTKAELDKARQEKKSPAEMPRPVVAVMDLATGKITAKIERVNSFAVVGEGAGLLVYRRPAKSADKTEPMKDEKKEEKPPEKKDDKAPAKAPPRTYGTELVLRNLADGSERTLEEVSEYTITRDGKTLVYAVSSKKEENNGVYAITELPKGEATPLLAGKGKILAADLGRKAAQLVFFSDKDDAAAEKPKAKLYHWDRHAVTRPVSVGKDEGKPRLAAATDLLTLTPSGIRSGWSITERGTVSFSADGTNSTWHRAPSRRRRRRRRPRTSPNEEKVVVDLWHYKDEYDPADAEGPRAAGPRTTQLSGRLLPQGQVVPPTLRRERRGDARRRPATGPSASTTAVSQPDRLRPGR